MKRVSGLARAAGRRLLAGASHGLRTMMVKELRSRTRGWRSPLVISLYLLGLGGLSIGMYALMARMARFGGPGVSPEIGLQIFSTMAVFQLLLIAFIIPALTAGAISGERERRTMDLLLVTRMTPAGIVLGKLLSSIGYILLLLVSSLPVFCLVFYFGGIPPGVLGMVLAISAAAAITYGTVGLFISALLKRTQAAAVATYAIVFGLVFGAMMATQILGQVPRFPPEPFPKPPLTAYVSPLYALTSVLPNGGMGMEGGPMLGPLTSILPFLGGGFGGPPVWAFARKGVDMMVVGMGGAPAAPGMPQPPKLPDPWVYHLMFDGALVLVLILATMILVAPVKPWHRLGGRLRRRTGGPRRRWAGRWPWRGRPVPLEPGGPVVSAFMDSPPGGA